MSRGIIAQENYQTLKKESTDRKSQRLSMYEKRIHALARRKGRRARWFSGSIGSPPSTVSPRI